MTEVDLRELPSDEVVLHYGGRTNEVDAFTFSRSLISFADAIQEINRQLQPEFSVDVILDALGPGSFRARIKTKRRGSEPLFDPSTFPGAVIAGVLAAFIYDKAIKPEDRETIIISEQAVTIERGDDRVIVTREVWDAKERLPDKDKIDEHISAAFSVMERDASITGFGLGRELDIEQPVAVIPRDVFEILGNYPFDKP